MGGVVHKFWQVVSLTEENACPDNWDLDTNWEEHSDEEENALRLANLETNSDEYCDGEENGCLYNWDWQFLAKNWYEFSDGEEIGCHEYFDREEMVV